MLFADHRSDWVELDSLAEPPGGSSHPAGGFVFGDSFDVLLRQLSENYLRAAWSGLSSVLEQNQIAAEDLSWGWMHPGVTGFDDVDRAPGDSFAPGDYIGWTSCGLSEIWRTEQLYHLDEILKASVPPLRCTATYRSLKWRIAPDNFSLALKLIEALCTVDIPDWNPEVVLNGTTEPPELWRKMALAIRDDNQEYLDRTVEEAKRSYTSLGFRILVLGYTRYLDGGGYTGTLRLPPVV
jgi:hypothetical protein